MIKQSNIPLPTLQRLSLYRNLIQKEDGVDWISTSKISLKTGIKSITIRKDIAYLCIKGIPQKGYPKKELISKLKIILGGDSYGDIILVGSWGLGVVFRDTPDLIPEDFKIRACFDFVKEDKHSTIPVYPIDRLKDLLPRIGVSMAILSVEPDKAQNICNQLFLYGIEGVLNITNVQLDTNKNNKIVNYNLINGLSDLLGFIKS